MAGPGGTSGSRTYFGWQPEKVAFVFGMSAQRAVLLSVAVLAGIWPLATSRIQVAILTWPIAALLCGIVLVRIAGRTSCPHGTNSQRGFPLRISRSSTARLFP